jgi:hypothetical protein
MDRLTTLPNRELTMTAELMELAWGDGSWIYLVRLSPVEGQPVDPTKEELDVSLFVLDPQGAQKLDYPRQTTLTMYDDPSPAIGTPADHDEVAVIMAFAEAQLPLMQASAARLLAAKPLYERLAATAPQEEPAGAG